MYVLAAARFGLLAGIAVAVRVADDFDVQSMDVGTEIEDAITQEDGLGQLPSSLQIQVEDPVTQDPAIGPEPPQVKDPVTQDPAVGLQPPQVKDPVAKDPAVGLQPLPAAEEKDAAPQDSDVGLQPPLACIDLTGVYLQSVTDQPITLVQKGCSGESSYDWGYTVSGPTLTITGSDYEGVIGESKGLRTIVWPNGDSFTEAEDPGKVIAEAEKMMKDKMEGIVDKGPGSMGMDKLNQDANPISVESTGCEMEEVIDPNQCGVDIIDGFKDELICQGCSSYDQHCTWPWCPRCPANCRETTEIPRSCQVKTMCSYRLRAVVQGEVYTSAFENLTVALEAVSFEVVDADDAVAALLQAAQDELNNHLPGIVNGEIRKVLQPQVEDIKVRVEQTMIKELSKDRDLFGPFSDYITLETFVDNVTDFVNEMLPSSSLTSRVGNIAGPENETIDAITATLKIERFQSYVIANVCETIDDLSFYWLRMVPFLVVALAVAFKYPRSAVGVILAGVFFNFSWTTRLCHVLTPSLTSGLYSFKVSTGQAMVNAGGPETLAVDLGIGEGDVGSLTATVSLSQEFLEGYLESMIDAIGDNNGTMPVRVEASRIALRADGHHIFIEPTSSVEVTGKMDLRCAPSCGIGFGALAS